MGYFMGGKAWELRPNTVSSLMELRHWCDNNGCQLGVVSNMDERLPCLLEALGIRHFFDFVLTSYAFGQEKPSAAIFREARRLAGVTEDGLCIHVGDSLQRDVVGAQAAGFAAMLVDPDCDGLQKQSDVGIVENDLTASTYCVPHI